MAESEIDYDGIAQNVLRGVVRAVLDKVNTDGLPGEHHFYVCFDTRAPGVTMSRRLREQYPEEMTIVLQHRFWDLIVEPERFEVKLSFNSIPERLVVPYQAIKVFYDPSVPYGLQFEPSKLMGEGGQKSGRVKNLSPVHRPHVPGDDLDNEPVRPSLVGPAPRGLLAEFPSGRIEAGNGAGQDQGASDLPKDEDVAVKPPHKAPGKKDAAAEAPRSGAKGGKGKSDAADAPDAAPVPAAGTVVSLDAFRKK